MQHKWAFLPLTTSCHHRTSLNVLMYCPVFWTRTNGEHDASTDGNDAAYVACATRMSFFNASEGQMHSRKRTCQRKMNSNCIFAHSTQLDRRGKALLSKKNPSEQLSHLLQNGRTESFPIYNCHLDCFVPVLPGDKVSLLESCKR